MRTSFHHQPEAQHPKSPAIETPAGRLPHLMNGQSGTGRAFLQLGLVNAQHGSGSNCDRGTGSSSIGQVYDCLWDSHPSSVSTSLGVVAKDVTSRSQGGSCHRLTRNRDEASSVCTADVNSTSSRFD